MWQMVNGQAVDLPYQVGTPIQMPFGAPQQSIPYNVQVQQQQPVYAQNNAPKLNTNIVCVYGADGAKNYPLPNNSDIVLFDNDKDIIYRVSVDGTGKRDVLMLDLSEHKEEAPIDFSSFATKEDIAELRKEFASIKQSKKPLTAEE